LEQVVINMITNALQSLTSQAGAVSVTTGLSADGSEVIIRFRDEGKGMDRETIAKLAEPFFSTRHEAGGTGLGVYIATNIIKELKGTITYDSEPLRGTTVTVRLPAAATSPEYVAADNSREELP
jgi:signal transduction histidine kinase